MSDETSESGPSVRRGALGARARRVRALVVVALLALPLGGYGVECARYSGRVWRGVSVGGTPLAGLDRGAAEARARELGASLAARRITVQVRDQRFELEPASIGFALDASATAARALAAGRSGGWARSLGFRIARLRAPSAIEPVVSFDRAKLEALLDDWERRAVDLPFSGGVVADASGVRADPSRRGHRVDRERAHDAIRTALVSADAKPVVLPLRESEPFVAPGAVASAVERAKRLVAGDIRLIADDAVELRITKAELTAMLRSRAPTEQDPQVWLGFDATAMDAKLAELRAKLEGPPENARFMIASQDRVVIVPGHAGTVIAASAVADAALQAAASPGRVGPLPIRRGAAPEVSAADLEALHVRHLVGKYTTFHACCQPRVDNIHHIADMMRGTLVKPGEIYSINAMLGPRTTKNGFKEAPTIEEGEMVDALGGGVSQFATTIFNALFLAGYDIKERVPHTYYFARYPMGRDATLSWPKPDIIFANDSEAGLLIWTEYTDKSITVKVFGDNGGRKVEFKVSPQQDITKPAIEYIPDMTQDPDREKVKQAGQIGWTVFVTREIRFPDGTKKEEKRKVTYKPRVRRVIVHPCKVPEGEPGYTGEKCPEKDAGAEAPPEP